MAAAESKSRSQVVAALLACLVAGAACRRPAETDAGGSRGDEPAEESYPQKGEVRLVVRAAEVRVPLGGDVVFHVKVENASKAAIRVNRPRLSRNSVSFRVRSDAFDLAWIDRIRIREGPQGAAPDPETVAEIAPGGSIEGEVRATAVMTGKLTFLPVYTWQGAPEPVTSPPISVEVTPADGKAHLGWRIETSQGTIEARFRPDLAFGTCEAIASLAKSGFYDGLTFHRAVQGFMAQGGDPTGQGWGGPGFMLRPEFHGKLPHRRGVISMARQTRPDTAGSQFFVMFGEAAHLDKAGYTAFADMVSGDEALARLETLAANPIDRSGSEAPRERITIKKTSLVLLP
jgi:cyclophilin family peptidyl-prolyl cis-trans isomerase